MQTEYERRMRQIIRLMAQVKRYCLELGILLLLAGAVWFLAARIYRSVGVLLGRKRGRKRGRKAKKAKKGIAAILIGLLLGAALGLYGFSPAYAQTGEADRIADSGQTEAVSGLSEEEEAGKEASPYIIKGFEILAKGESSSYKGVLCTDGAVEAVLVFACHDPDPESVQVRMIPQDTRARRSVENSEFGEGDGGISLPGFQILQIEKDVYELRVQFFEEGKWKAVFYCEDRMGHALQGVRDGDSEDFIIDASSPLLEVSYEELIRITEKVCLPEKIGQDFSVDLAAIESSDGEAFFDPGRARTVICLKDDTFDPDRIRLEILRDDSGENISGEKGEQASPEDYVFVKKWEKISENTYRTILDFCEEGHYRIRISGTDAAGRSLIAEEAAETEACLKEGLYTSPLLTVDHSPPDISCQAVEGSMDVRPAVRIRVREDHFHPRFLQLEDQVLDADGKVIDSLSLKDYRLEFTPIMTRDTYVYFWKDHPFAKRKEISLEELKDYPCISFDQDSDSNYYLTEEALADYDFEKLIKSDDRATTMELIAQLHGYSIGSGMLSGEDVILKGLVSVKLKEEDPLVIGYITRKDTELSEYGRCYVEKLLKYKEI